MRADDQGRGFVFFNNRQPVLPLAEKSGIQLDLRTKAGSVLVPQSPITIPAGAYGIWPVGLDCSGVMLAYGTVQPLCSVAAEDGTVTWFFSAIDGVRPELMFKGDKPKVVKPGAGVTAVRKNSSGNKVQFVVLTPRQAEGLSRQTFAGRPRALLSEAAVFADGSVLRLENTSAEPIKIGIYPPVTTVSVAGKRMKGNEEGIFNSFKLPAAKFKEEQGVATLVKPAGATATQLKGDLEATWADAAVYEIKMPANASGHRVLDLHYVGDAARFYAGDRFVLDDFYNGDPLRVPLWRLASEDFSKLRLKVLPYSEALDARLPELAKEHVAAAKGSDSLDKVGFEITDVRDMIIEP